MGRKFFMPKFTDSGYSWDESSSCWNFTDLVTDGTEVYHAGIILFWLLMGRKFFMLELYCLGY